MLLRLGKISAEFRSWGRLVAAAIIACVAVSFGVGWWVHPLSGGAVDVAPGPAYNRSRTFWISGSLCGRQVGAYSSDQDGKRDLYVKQVAAGP